MIEFNASGVLWQTLPKLLMQYVCEWKQKEKERKAFPLILPFRRKRLQQRRCHQAQYDGKWFSSYGLSPSQLVDENHASHSRQQHMSEADEENPKKFPISLIHFPHTSWSAADAASISPPQHLAHLSTRQCLDSSQLVRIDKFCSGSKRGNFQ